MTAVRTPPPPVAEPAGLAGTLDSLCREALGGPLPVRLRAWDGSEAGPLDAPTVVLRSPQALRRLLWHPGELGLAQAYVTGDLDVEGDLAEGFRRIWRAQRQGNVIARRPKARQWPGLVKAAARIGALGLPPAAPQSQSRLTGRLHSLGRDRAAISHHYDLSNDFYGLLLDPTMAYSCGYYRQDVPTGSLETAQRDKLDLVATKLGVRSGSRHLDIGCGWGSLSLHLAEHYGAHVIGVTLSQEQQSFVRARIAERNLERLVEVRLQDYREVAEGGFDSVSSIEMGEHVGADNYPTFARIIAEKLRPQGRALIQQMSRRGRPGGGAFIESFIAPDMHMRPVGETVTLLEDAGLEVRDVHAMREHYVRTVEAWRTNFEANWDRAVAMVGEEVARVWRLYLVGGGLAFEEGRMGVDQILAVRRAGDGRSGMASLRAA
jgi:cyclopropane-fatty-acyl-phospholipid synthase